MRTNFMFDDFLNELNKAKQAVLLLDYDGTLAPFSIERDHAIPYQGVRLLLSRIRQDTNTRLVIISGRSIDDLLPLLALSPSPEIWGCHGWETLAADGQRSAVPLPAQAVAGLRAARSWIVHEGLEEYCEMKPASLAVHWRGCPEQVIAELRERVSRGWQALAANNGLQIHPFNGGLELRCPGEDKGTVVKSILADIDPATTVAFLGDDLTDEDGFTVLKDRGLCVLVSHEARPTAADLRIVPPQGLLDFLVAWHDKAPRKDDPSRKDMP
jgi:trehalose 6-phosphate phosphatase